MKKSKVLMDIRLAYILVLPYVLIAFSISFLVWDWFVYGILTKPSLFTEHVGRIRYLAPLFFSGLFYFSFFNEIYDWLFDQIRHHRGMPQLLLFMKGMFYVLMVQSFFSLFFGFHWTVLLGSKLIVICIMAGDILGILYKGDH